jgi:hypothetical protein
LALNSSYTIADTLDGYKFKAHLRRNDIMLDRHADKQFYCKYALLIRAPFIYKDNPNREHKREERRQYETHLQEVEQAEPILVLLDINYQVLDALN